MDSALERNRRRVLCLVVLWGCLLLPGMLPAAEWRIVSRSAGIVGYTRPSAFPLDEVRAVGVVEASLPALEALLRDVPAETRFGYRCREAYRLAVPGLSPTPDCFPFYYRMHLPYPVRDRDALARVNFTYDKDNAVLTARIQVLDLDYSPRPGAIRMRRGDASFVLKALAADRTEVTYTAQCDPEGGLPDFLVNMFLKDFAPTTLAKIRDVVKDLRYTTAAQVTTTTPTH